MTSPAAPLKNDGFAEDATSAAPLSPGMAQYMEIKSRHQDFLLFYRMGDFYELFFDDAVKAAAVLDIALTKRGQIRGVDIPMCGVPVHSSDFYLEKLIANGIKVAICEQLEDPSEAKKRGSKSVVHRDVVRIVTPGTVTEETLLAPDRSNYLASIAEVKSDWALAWMDISTGEFSVIETSPAQLASELARLTPSEILISEQECNSDRLSAILSDHKACLTPIPESSLHGKRSAERLREYYGLSTLDAWGDFTLADLACCGALLDYVHLTQKDTPPRLDAPKKYAASSGLAIDAATRRNLELVSTLSGMRQGSLLSTIDRTQTACGARLLASRLCNPLTDVDTITARHDAVAFFVEHASLRSGLRDTLRRCPDLERALGRLMMQRGGPRDLAALRDGLSAATAMADALRTIPHGSLPEEVESIVAGLGTHTSLIAHLTATLKDELPMLARDGNFIRAGYDAALDEFRCLRDESKKLIAAMEVQYKTATDIPSLKIKYNYMLGFFIEVTKKHEAKIPFEYIHRQTMKDAMRYTTPELAEIEKKIAEAADRALRIELEIFERLVEEIRADAHTIVAAGRAIAALDVTAALSELAQHERYCRPVIDDSLTFRITGGRHPVVESFLGREGQRFIANGCDLTGDQRLWLITGPNMAGKSTFLRQNALLALMAQMGSFIPATEAHIGIIDRLYSRVGASDDLARGRSTFMVEMVETAAILSQATSRSLVILDEIGRGTATYDGLSIAWAVAEHLHNATRCRGLFATHYHELTHLKESLSSLALYTVKVKEWKGNVIFLHEVAAGTADRSYGIHVAQLAGLPEKVIARAKVLLKALETSDHSPVQAITSGALPLFAMAGKPATVESAPVSHAMELLSTIKPDELSPKEALDVLYRLKSLSG